MSGHHDVQPTGSHSEIQHLTLLSDHFGALIDQYCDVLIVVSGHRFKGHKPILAARSEYFRALFYGDMMESKQAEIELKGISVPAFTALLKYIYTGQLSLANQNEKVLLEILGLAHQYGFMDLELSISEYLCQIIQMSNVFMIYEAAQLHHQNFLAGFCCSFMDRNAQELIRHESLLHLSSIDLKQIISRDTFYAPEVDIFRAVANWIQANKVDGSQSVSVNSLCSNCSDTVDGTSQARTVREVLSAVRFPLLSLSDIVSVVRPSNLLSDVAILEAIEAIEPARDKELKLRGYLVPEVNIALPSYGAQVLLGEMGSALWVGDSVNFDGKEYYEEEGYTRHVIRCACDQGILIKLGTQTVLNHIKMLLFDKDGRSYSYYVEVSTNEKDWERVIDHTGHLCRSWQYLHFESRAVRFIRIVGTKNTVSNSFHAVSLEALYTNAPITLVRGLVVPKVNVAAAEHGASVIEGHIMSDNIFSLDLNVYNTHYYSSGGSIVVQLGQPYMLDSMRFKLWDLDDGAYRYKVEVSVNFSDWELVVDKTGEDCRSWQTLSFERRPVVFIRIEEGAESGPHLHCVDLHCPAETSDAETQPSKSFEHEENL